MSNQTTRLNDGDDLEVAHPEDFGISRDGDGELLPKKQRIPGTDRAIVVLPLVQGEAEEYDDVLDADNPDDERVEALFENHIVEGIGSSGNLDEIPDYVVPGLIQALKNSSGHEVFRAVEDQQMKDQMGMVQAMAGQGDDTNMMRDLIQAGKEALEDEEDLPS